MTKFSQVRAAPLPFDSEKLNQGPMFGVEVARDDQGKAIPNMFQGAIYRMLDNGQRTLARISPKRQDYGSAYVEAARMANVKGIVTV